MQKSTHIDQIIQLSLWYLYSFWENQTEESSNWNESYIDNIFMSIQCNYSALENSFLKNLHHIETNKLICFGNLLTGFYLHKFWLKDISEQTIR